MINLKNTRILGHRGARNEAFENTLSGFEYARHLQPNGLAGVEFDVQLTADEHLIIFHDDTLQRLCGLQSRVDQLSLSEIQRHLQSGHHIITLDMLAHALPLSSTYLPSKSQRHALDNLFGISQNTFLAPSTSLIPMNMLERFAHIELEVKTHDRTNYSKLMRALTHYLVDSPLATIPIVLTSFDTHLLAQLQRNKLLACIPRGLLVRFPESLPSAPNTALQLGCRQLGVYHLLLNRAIIQSCHRYGLPVSAWTVNDINRVEELVLWDVDFIITDTPTLFL